MSRRITAVNHETIGLLKRGLAIAAAAESSRSRMDWSGAQGNFVLTVQVRPRLFGKPEITIEVAEVAVPKDAR